MAAGFEQVNQRVDALDNRVADVERGLKGLSYEVDQLDQKLDQHREESAKLDTLPLGRRNR
jgi:chaperonin cofactor prefoldin